MKLPIIKIVLTFFTAGILFAGFRATFNYSSDDGFDLYKFLLDGLFFGTFAAGYTAYLESLTLKTEPGYVFISTGG